MYLPKSCTHRKSVMYNKHTINTQPINCTKIEINHIPKSKGKHANVFDYKYKNKISTMV